jgi:hypothetical protein
LFFICLLPVLLNDPGLMETMFNDQNYMTSVGALECASAVVFRVVLAALSLR